ncbi:hypothetical protein SK3146_03029 [Paenibacillus konkukensis]|uniref:Uncharacterized protein n=1 Tax=Paenibacillus konkukensis TaxID=2020716 RepID=A0ABY4RP91_9BACL|nr:hypothetical protein [Paenibacillus konkukensis]UQZ83822.1 hypothetical protein SK3146_03029 [Paenibacillus konkukensis]
MSVLWSENCLKCGADGKFQSYRQIVRTIRRRQTARDAMIAFSISLAAFFLAETLLQMVISVLAGIALVAGYFLLANHYASSVENRLLHQLLATEHQAIRDGMLLDLEDAANDLKADDFKTAYEKLREIGYLITGNQVKVLKLMCLSHFIVRSDMDLELSTLIPSGFEPDFIRYLHEVSKVSPQLVGRDALDYVMRHRQAIEAFPGGPETLALTASAALRVKGYVLQYPGLIADYLDALPRDRLLRLCKLLQGSRDRVPELYDKAREQVKLKYDFDPEFQGLL